MPISRSFTNIKSVVIPIKELAAKCNAYNLTTDRIARISLISAGDVEVEYVDFAIDDQVNVSRCWTLPHTKYQSLVSWIRVRDTHFFEVSCAGMFECAIWGAVIEQIAQLQDRFKNQANELFCVGGDKTKQFVKFSHHIVYMSSDKGSRIVNLRYDERNSRLISLCYTQGHDGVNVLMSALDILRDIGQLAKAENWTNAAVIFDPVDSLSRISLEGGGIKMFTNSVNGQHLTINIVQDDALGAIPVMGGRSFNSPIQIIGAVTGRENIIAGYWMGDDRITLGFEDVNDSYPYPFSSL